MFRLLKSKKGFTLVELLIVVTVLSIVTAVAVPLFSSAYTIKMVEDCNNQRVVVSSHIQEVMAGMIDNGRTQKFIDFTKVKPDRKTKYPGDGVTGNGDDAYVGKECFVLVYDKELPAKSAFTIGDIRGGYRDINNPKCGDDAEGYRNGCDIYGNYLKKERLKDDKFYLYLANEEIPICPFADFENSDKKDDYRYYIFTDGTVLCDCPECNEIED